MSEYDAFIFFTAFISLYFIFMIPMGGASALNENIAFNETDLTITPDIETPEARIYNVENDAEESVNVTFYDLSQVDGDIGLFSDIENYQVQRVAGKTNNTTTSYIVYDISRWDRINTVTTNRALDATDITFRFQSDQGSALRTVNNVLGPQSFEVNNSIAELNVSFTGATNDYFYYLEGTEGEEFTGVTGAFTVSLAWIVAVLDYVLNLVSIATSLPFYLNIPFLIYLGYVIWKGIPVIGG